jgi:hypothetical protein
MINTVRQLWDQHESSPIPSGFRGVSVEGVSLTLIHSDIAANIMTFIQTGGALGRHRVETLKQRKALLKMSLDSLTPDSRAYFERIDKISDLIMPAV